MRAWYSGFYIMHSEREASKCGKPVLQAEGKNTEVHIQASLRGTLVVGHDPSQRAGKNLGLNTQFYI